MAYTSKYNLKKPEYSEQVDVADHNENMDKIDDALGDLRTDVTDGITKRVDLYGQIQTASHRRSVITLCELTNANPHANSYSAGVISFHRNNGLSGAKQMFVTFEKKYDTTVCNYNALYIGNENVPQACTFVYNGIKYGGLEMYISQAESQYVAFSGESNFDIFGVDYYDTKSDEAIIPEIADSLNFDEPIATGNLYFNGIQVATQPWVRTNDIYPGVLKIGPAGCKIDASDGTMRLRAAPSAASIAIRGDTNTVEFYLSSTDTAQHVFREDGTKAGGSIIIDGENLGMSPTDSPRVQIQDTIADVRAVPAGTHVKLEERFAKAVSKYSVFPSRPVTIENKRSDGFIVKGTGLVDLMVVGTRRGYEDTYWMELPENKESNEA